MPAPVWFSRLTTALLNGAVSLSPNSSTANSEFVVARAHGVVDVHDDRLGQVVERVDGDGGQSVRIGGIYAPCRGELGLAALAPPPPRPQP